MIDWMKARWAVLLIGLVAVGAIIGAGGVAAARIHSGDSSGVKNQSILGTIQSVDSTKQTFVLLPDAKKNPQTLSFDTKTTIEGGKATLKAGVHVRVEVLKRADGSLYATEVERSPTKPGNDDGVNDHEQDGGDHDGTKNTGHHAPQDGSEKKGNDQGSDS